LTSSLDSALSRPSRGTRRSQIRPSQWTDGRRATVSRMPPQSLGTAVIIAALALAGWCLITTVRTRTLSPYHWSGLGSGQAPVVVEIGFGVVHLARGAHPHEYATFIGYLIVLFLILPLAMLLARLEPTRWGALIVTVAALVVPVLIVRINQLWT